MEDIKALKDMYNIVSLEIFGLDAIKSRISSKTFVKSIIDAKKKLRSFKLTLNKELNSLGEEAKDVNIFVKLFNDFYIDINLVNKSDNDIAKMLCESTNKKLATLENLNSIELEKKTVKLLEGLREILKYNIYSWQDYI